jgi:hypothetical protein
MKLAYIVTPVVLTLCFAGYTFWYSKGKERAAVRVREEAVGARNAAIDAVYSGEAFVGRNGKKEAQADISRGAPKLFLYGKTRADIEERTVLLKQRFGVTLDPLAGCIVSEPLVTFADSYNAEVRGFIAAKFGPTAFDDLDREALAFWESKRKNEKG